MLHVVLRKSNISCNGFPLQGSMGGKPSRTPFWSLNPWRYAFPTMAPSLAGFIIVSFPETLRICCYQRTHISRRENIMQFFKGKFKMLPILFPSTSPFSQRAYCLFSSQFWRLTGGLSRYPCSEFFFFFIQTPSSKRMLPPKVNSWGGRVASLVQFRAHHPRPVCDKSSRMYRELQGKKEPSNILSCVICHYFICIDFFYCLWV